MNVSSILSTDSDALRSYKLMMQERAQRAAEAVKQLTVVLTARGVTTVVAEYDGRGDSGQIESIGYRSATGESYAELPTMWRHRSRTCCTAD